MVALLAICVGCAPERQRSELLLATSNAGKIAELSGLLAGRGIEVLGLADIPAGDQAPPSENGKSYCENAIIKAECWQARSGLPTLADEAVKGPVVDQYGPVFSVPEVLDPRLFRL